MRYHAEFAQLTGLWGAFRSSQVLFTAIELGVFDCLTTPKTAENTASGLKTDVRATEILLDALVSLGLLEKKNLSRPKYRLSKLSRIFLVNGGRYYQGDIIRHALNLAENWAGLGDVLRTGKPSRRSGNHDAFIGGMHNIASTKVAKVIAAIGMKGVATAADLGGGPGTYAIEMAKKGVSVTLIDLPETLQIASGRIESSGMKEKISLREGNLLTDNLGGHYDLVFISQILHSFSPEQNTLILRKAKGSLTETGRLVIQEFYLDSTNTAPVSGALFAVNMLVNTEGGRTYNEDVIHAWLKEAGFRNIRTKRIRENILFIARQ